MASPAGTSDLHSEMSSASSYYMKVQEWQRALVIGVSALLAFETITGLANWLLPFSIANQVMVLLHTAVGIILLAPYAWYQVRHWMIYRHLRLSHVVLTGYFAFVSTLLLSVSGVVLTVQALASTRISYAWDILHLIATGGLLASSLPHLVTAYTRATRSDLESDGARRKSSRTYLQRTLFATALLMALVPAGWMLAPSEQLDNALPKDYSYVYGADRPFAPSLARTASGGAYDARSLAGSASCATSGCHETIYQEWQVSAHRYAAMDAAFQKVQETMGKQNGAESTRYCGGCHDPISLFSGTKNIFTKDLTGLVGFQEGVSCVACHAITETDVKGNAAYVMSQPARYLYEFADTLGGRRVLRDFLIRAYPRQHVASLQHKLFKSPEFCAACHKQFIDEEINKVGWVQLQNQYDNWRKSRWNHPSEPEKTIECRECHMPLQQASSDPGRGDDLDYNRTQGDGKHRSHRFLGANQWMPKVLDLPGAEEHIRLTEAWLRGELEVPEIADKWKTGAAVPIALLTPLTTRAGAPLTIEAVLSNNKVGHDFPTGPLDIIQSWVEVEVTDQTGRVIFSDGQRDSAHFIAPGAFMLKAEPVDQYGNLIDRHNLWEMVGVRYRRSLFPGFADRQEFTFTSPRREVTELHVTARLMYRKADQFLINFLFGASSGITSPVTMISEDRKTIRVVND